MLDICSSCKTQLGIAPSTPEREASKWVVKFISGFIAALAPCLVDEPSAIYLSALIPAAVWAWITLSIVTKCDENNLIRFGLLSFVANPVGLWFGLLALNLSFAMDPVGYNYFNLTGASNAIDNMGHLSAVLLLFTYCAGTILIYGDLTKSVTNKLAIQLANRCSNGTEQSTHRKKSFLWLEFALITSSFIVLPLWMLHDNQAPPLNLWAHPCSKLIIGSFILSFYGLTRMGSKITPTHQHDDKFENTPHKLLLCSKNLGTSN